MARYFPPLVEVLLGNLRLDDLLIVSDAYSADEYFNDIVGEHHQLGTACPSTWDTNESIEFGVAIPDTLTLVIVQVMREDILNVHMQLQPRHFMGAIHVSRVIDRNYAAPRTFRPNFTISALDPKNTVTMILERLSYLDPRKRKR